MFVFVACVCPDLLCVNFVFLSCCGVVVLWVVVFCVVVLVVVVVVVFMCVSVVCRHNQWDITSVSKLSYCNASASLCVQPLQNPIHALTKTKHS